MKKRVLNDIDSNIKILKNITVGSNINNYWELNVLLDKHYAMRNLVLEDEDINYDNFFKLVLDLEKEIDEFLPQS